MALREATMEEHHRVDALFAGFCLSDEASYADFLTAHARALGSLEAAAQGDSPRMALLEADLAALGRPVPAPLPMCAQGGEAFRWGLRYALEGSRLGGAMLARQVGPGLPLAYLSATHEKGGWLAFQARLDAAADDGEAAWVDEAVRGAQAAFDMFATAGAAAEATPHG